MGNIIVPTIGFGKNERRNLDLVHDDRCAEYEKKIFHNYDKDLVVFWIPSKKRYSIWTRDKKGRAYMLYICVDKKTGAYREPNRKDLEFIYKMDMYRKDKSYSILKEIEKHNRRIEQEQKKKLSDAVREISKERWRQFAGNPVVRVPIDVSKLKGGSNYGKITATVG